jgi:hypothetical protein
MCSLLTDLGRLPCPGGHALCLKKGLVIDAQDCASAWPLRNVSYYQYDKTTVDRLYQIP